MSGSCLIPKSSSKIAFFYVIVIIKYIHSDLSCAPIIVTVNPNKILSALVLAIRYSVLILVQSPVVMYDTEYSLIHIQ